MDYSDRLVVLDIIEKKDRSFENSTLENIARQSKLHKAKVESILRSLVSDGLIINSDIEDPQKRGAAKKKKRKNFSTIKDFDITVEGLKALEKGKQDLKMRYMDILRMYKANNLAGLRLLFKSQSTDIVLMVHFGFLHMNFARLLSQLVGFDILAIEKSKTSPDTGFTELIFGVMFGHHVGHSIDGGSSAGGGAKR